MRRLQPRVQTRKFWESLTDEELLGIDLVTDDPEGLRDLVREVPSGDEETYVEFKYDLRKSGRQEEFTCVHGHHKHLAGFVMRKGNARFLVGWMCGESIYGEDFDQYKADFDTAVNRQETLRRRRDIEKDTLPFMAWMEGVLRSDIFRLYKNVRKQIYHHLPWIWDNVPRASYLGASVHRVKMPATMFLDNTDPEAELGRVIADMSALGAGMIAKQELEEKSVANIKRVLNSLIRRIEVLFDQLKEVEDFFQPGVLNFVCELANEFDNPKKRKYSFGLGNVTCKRDRGKTTVQIPANYHVPDRSGLEALKEALRLL